MSKDRSPITRAAESLKTDNLRLINGIGPAVEKRLYGIGIFTYTQLAALSPADIAAAVSDLAGLSAERIIKQDWIGQARKLAAVSTSLEVQAEGKVTVEPQISKEHTLDPSSLVKTQEKIEPLTTLYRSATFMVELLLDEYNNVYSSHILHFQSGGEHTWSNWPKQELIDFMSQSARLDMQSGEPVRSDIEKLEQTSESVPESEKHFTQQVKMSELAGMLRVRNMQISGVEATSHQIFIANEQPLDVRLTLDFTKMIIPGATPLSYKATVFGKRRDPGSRSGQIVGESEGVIIPAETVIIDIRCHPLSQGTYQLAATIIVGLPDTKLTPKSGNIAITDGGLVQIYSSI